MTDEVKLGGVYIKYFAKTGAFDRANRRVISKLRRLQNEARKTKRSIRNIFLAGGATAFATGVALRPFAQYELQMAAVRAITSSTDAEFRALSKSSKDLGRTTRFTAAQVAMGQKYLAMAGYDTDKILKSIESTLQLSQIGMLDLGRAADIASNILTAFNIEADKTGLVVDVIARTVTRANTDVEQMGIGMSYVAPVAKGLGLTLQETAAAVGVLGNAGIQAARVGTGLRRTIGELASPSFALREVMAEVGLTIEDVSPRVNEFSKVLENLAESGMTTEQVLRGFGLIAAPSVIAMKDNVKAYKDLYDGILDSAGATKEMIDFYDRTVDSAFKRVISALQGMSIGFGELYSKDIQEGLDSIADGLNYLTDNMEKVVEIAISLGTELRTLAIALVAMWTGNKIIRVIGGIAALVIALKELRKVTLGVAAAQTLAGAAKGGWIGLGVGGAAFGLEAFTNDSEYDTAIKRRDFLKSRNAAINESLSSVAGPSNDGLLPFATDAGLQNTFGERTSQDALREELDANTKELNLLRLGLEGGKYSKTSQGVVSKILKDAFGGMMDAFKEATSSGQSSTVSDLLQNMQSGSYFGGLTGSLADPTSGKVGNLAEANEMLSEAIDNQFAVSRELEKQASDRLMQVEKTRKEFLKIKIIREAEKRLQRDIVGLTEVQARALEAQHADVVRNAEIHAEIIANDEKRIEAAIRFKEIMADQSSIGEDLLKNAKDQYNQISMTREAYLKMSLTQKVWYDYQRNSAGMDGEQRAALIDRRDREISKISEVVAEILRLEEMTNALRPKSGGGPSVDMTAIMERQKDIGQDILKSAKDRTMQLTLTRQKYLEQVLLAENMKMYQEGITDLTAEQAEMLRQVFEQMKLVIPELANESAGIEDFNNELERTQGMVLDIGNSIGNFAAQAVLNFNNIAEAARQMGQAILSALANRFIAQPIADAAAGAIGSVFNIPGMADGGHARGLTIVGERGPELVDFQKPGQVYSNERLREVMAGGRATDVNVNVTATRTWDALHGAVQSALSEATPAIIDAAYSVVQSDMGRPSAMRSTARL